VGKYDKKKRQEAGKGDATYSGNLNVYLPSEEKNIRHIKTLPCRKKNKRNGEKETSKSHHRRGLWFSHKKGPNQFRQFSHQRGIILGQPAKAKNYPRGSKKLVGKREKNPGGKKPLIRREVQPEGCEKNQKKQPRVALHERKHLRRRLGRPGNTGLNKRKKMSKKRRVLWAF